MSQCDAVQKTSSFVVAVVVAGCIAVERKLKYLNFKYGSSLSFVVCRFGYFRGRNAEETIKTIHWLEYVVMQGNARPFIATQRAPTATVVRCNKANSLSRQE